MSHPITNAGCGRFLLLLQLHILFRSPSRMLGRLMFLVYLTFHHPALAGRETV